MITTYETVLHDNNETSYVDNTYVYIYDPSFIYTGSYCDNNDTLYVDFNYIAIYPATFGVTGILKENNEILYFERSYIELSNFVTVGEGFYSTRYIHQYDANDTGPLIITANKDVIFPIIKWYDFIFWDDRSIYIAGDNDYYDLTKKFNILASHRSGYNRLSTRFILSEYYE